MKILHLIDTLGIGGAEQMLVTVLPALQAAGHEVGVAVLREPLTLEPALEAEGVPVQKLTPLHKWNLIAGARAVAKSANDGGYDIVHAHLFFPGVYTGLAKLLRLTKARTCITYHNQAYAPGCNKPGPGLWLRKRLNELSSRFGMNGRLAVSQAVADHYRQHLNLGPIQVIPNPVDIGAIENAVRGVKRNSGRALHVLLPGRLVPEKGHAVLIDALQKLVQDGLDVRAIFAGDGPLKDTMITQINQAGLSEHINMAGFLPHEKLLKLMRKADIVIVPSVFEGFGLTAVEALLAGTPVIAARTGGLAEIIDHDETGILFPSGDDAALAQAISELASDSAGRKKIAKAGRAICKSRYGLPEITERLSAFYAGLMKGGA